MKLRMFFMKRRSVFLEQAKHELDVVCNAIQEIIGLAMRKHKDRGYERSQEIEPLEEVVDRLVEELKAVHIDRSKNGLCNIEVGVNFLDILTNVERISDHCSNIAVYLIANQEKYNSLKKHEYLDKLHKIGPDYYEKLLAEYSEKFAL